MTRPIELYASDLNLYTRWMSSNDKEKLLEKARAFRTNLLTLVQTIDPDVKGAKMTFYELDADDFGMNGEIDDVSKYMITYDLLNDEQFPEIWSED